LIFRRILSSSIIFALSVLFASQAALATEHGGGVWPVGAESYATAASAPPAHGSAFFEYTCFYFANQLNDGTGHSAVPEFKLRAFAVAAEVVHNWGLKVPGGKLNSFVAVPVVYQQLHLPNGKFDRYNASNINIVPVAVFGHKKSAYWFYELQFETLPLGYQPDAALNIGQHNIAYTTGAGLTLVPHQGRQNISARFDYTLNNPNRTTHYHSGNEFFIQYNAQQEIPHHKASLGLQGYFYKQTTNDTLRGVPVVTTNADGSTSIGYKGRAWNLGPQATFPMGKHGVIVVKWSHDFLVQNKPQGNSLWFQFGIPLGTHKE
jgi:hypothetical protein